MIQEVGEESPVLIERVNPAACLFGEDADCVACLSQACLGDEDEDDWWEEDEPEVDYLYGSCVCGWQGTAMCWAGDSAGYTVAAQKLREKHRAKSPGCAREPLIY